MKKFKGISLLTALALSLTAFTSCKTISKSDKIHSDDPLGDGSVGSYITLPTTEPLQADTYPDYPVNVPEIDKQDTGTVYQAEECEYEGLNLASDRSGYSGEGYINGFNRDKNSLVFKVEAPSSQHYDIGFSIAADAALSCRVSVNNMYLGEFKTNSSGKFTLIKMYGIFLTKGEAVIEIKSDEGDIDLDYLQLTNNTNLGEISYEADGSLANENAAKNAKELMSFLTENYGKTIISGQYASDSTNKEQDFIYKITGKYPVIRFSDLETSYLNTNSSFSDIDAAADWYRKGGIVGLMWQWSAPSGTASVYAEETDFKLSSAVTNLDLALLSQEQIRGLYGEGRISEECYALILDIDSMAGQLLLLKNKGVPVLWRPLHEASGGWYWWGASGASDYKWLWSLMYKRMNEYFGLDNLIWVWNGQSAEYLVDDSMYDIAAVDIYLSENVSFSSRYEQFAALQKLVGKNKLIALSECSRLPNIDDCFRDNAVWSFFGLWYGSYLMNDKDEFSEKYIKKDEFIKIYNSEGVLTLDEYKDMS